MGNKCEVRALGTPSRLDEETGAQPRSWLPEPVAARVAEYQALPPSRGRFRWPRRE